MPKVLIVATSRKSRGGITSVILAHETGKQWRENDCRWIETVRDGGSFRKLWYFLRATIQYLFFLPTVDIVHVHSALGTSIRRKNIYISLAKLFNKKVILHFHAADPTSFDNSKAVKFYRKVFNKANIIIALSDNWKQVLVDKIGIPSDKIKVIYNPAPNVERGHKRNNTILFAGTLILRKGYDILIKAFAKISTKYPDWRLILAGNGEIENARILAASNGILDKVEMPGWVAGVQKDKLFQTASIFCLPSKAEGFPMAILDAWAYGIPCVVTPVGGIPELIVDGKDGLIVPTDNVDALSNALEQLISSEILRTQIVKSTDYRISTDFNIATICQRIGELYTQLIQ